MNERLARVKDGTTRRIAVKTSDEWFKPWRLARVFWPFAVHNDLIADDGWTVTHLPSGLRAASRMTDPQATALVRKLRELASVQRWEFRRPRGRLIAPLLRSAAAIVDAHRRGEEGSDHP